MVLDQIYIKEELVFDKYSGAIIGYADLGDVTNLFDLLESQIDKPEEQLQQVYVGIYGAKTIYKLMVPLCTVSGSI